jgi:hypothetical protein
MDEDSFNIEDWKMDNDSGSWNKGIDSLDLLDELIRSLQSFQLVDHRFWDRGYLSTEFDEIGTDRGGC